MFLGFLFSFIVSDLASTIILQIIVVYSVLIMQYIIDMMKADLIRLIWSTLLVEPKYALERGEIRDV